MNLNCVRSNDFLFTESNSEKILTTIRNGNISDVFSKLSYYYNNILVLDYAYFKYIATRETYDPIMNYIINNIDNILTTNPQFIVRVNMKGLSLVEIDKHKQFIQELSNYLKIKYPNKLSKCYIYNAPVLFSQLLNIISTFVDKETQKKFELL